MNWLKKKISIIVWKVVILEGGNLGLKEMFGYWNIPNAGYSSFQPILDINGNCKSLVNATTKSMSNTESKFETFCSKRSLCISLGLHSAQLLVSLCSPQNASRTLYMKPVGFNVFSPPFLQRSSGDDSILS